MNSDSFTMMRVDKDSKNIVLILDKCISSKKSRIFENSENPTRFLLCWVDLTYTIFEHFGVYL